VALECAIFQAAAGGRVQVGVSPEGKITGYEHKIPEAKAGAQPTRDAAQKTAQDFLVCEAGQIDERLGFSYGGSELERKPNRLDWAFTWEKHGFRAKDAPERLRILLHGEEVGSAEEALKVS